MRRCFASVRRSACASSITNILQSHDTSCAFRQTLHGRIANSRWSLLIVQSPIIRAKFGTTARAYRQKGGAIASEKFGNLFCGSDGGPDHKKKKRKSVSSRSKKVKEDSESLNSDEAITVEEFSDFFESYSRSNRKDTRKKFASFNISGGATLEEESSNLFYGSGGSSNRKDVSPPAPISETSQLRISGNSSLSRPRTKKNRNRGTEYANLKRDFGVNWQVVLKHLQAKAATLKAERLQTGESKKQQKRRLDAEKIHYALEKGGFRKQVAKDKSAMKEVTMAMQAQRLRTGETRKQQEERYQAENKIIYIRPQELFPRYRAAHEANNSIVRPERDIKSPSGKRYKVKY